MYATANSKKIGIQLFLCYKTKHPAYLKWSNTTSSWGVLLLNKKLKPQQDSIFFFGYSEFFGARTHGAVHRGTSTFCLRDGGAYSNCRKRRLSVVQTHSNCCEDKNIDNSTSNETVSFQR